MDPFTAIALVGNILQFVGYAKDVYKQAQQIRASEKGITKKNQEILCSVSELDVILDNIAAGTNSLDRSLGVTDKRIRDVGVNCQKLAKELRDDIENKAVKNRTNVLMVAKSVMLGSRRSGEIERKLNDLNELQKVLFKHLLAHIYNQQTGLEMAMVRLMEQNRKLNIARTEELKQFKADIEAAVESLKSHQSLKNQPEEYLKQMSSTLLDWSEHALSLSKEQAIINSLSFDSMRQRRDLIVDAHTNTFKWVYDQSLHYKEWLETGQGVYWVAGEPGSGKSTLLKYLSNDQTAHEALLKWAGDRKLIKASFYFWFSGSGLQKSQEGLLRSLLFEILRQCPSSIRTACQAKWDMNPKSAIQWDRRELMETLRLLRLKSPSTRFCFFIDGLDEYQGDPVAQGEANVQSHVTDIIDVMSTLASFPDIKLCLSSRTWHPFERAFGKDDSCKLYVNEKNRHDIRLYVRDKFEKADLFVNSSADGAVLQELVNDIVEDSRGVFLWVSLVIASLLQGLTNEDRPAELRRRLQKTPGTLNGVFERMLKSVDEEYLEQAAQILQVALHAVEPLPVIIYSYIGDEDHDPVKEEIIPWTKAQCASMSKTAEVRVKVRCPDLIKFTGPLTPPETMQQMGTRRVNFLHRTARDFLALGTTQTILNARLGKPFNPDLFICRSFLTMIKAASTSGHDTWSYPNELWAQLDQLTFYTRRLELEMGLPQTLLLDELKRVMTHQIGGGNLFLTGDSFMALMVQTGQRLYVETKLPVSLEEPGTPLLERALLPGPTSDWPVLSPVPPSSSMVALLLHHGARPNQFRAGSQKTIWEDYMVHIIRRSREPVFHTPELSETWISNIQELLQHGADPNLKCFMGLREAKVTVGKGKGIRYPVYMDLLEIIAEVFSPGERMYIQALIHSRRTRFLSNWVPDSLKWW